VRVRALKAFVLGVLGVGLLAYVAAAVVALAASVGGSDLDVRIGPLSIVSVERVADATSLGLGVGLVVVALVGGLANAVAAALIARRARQ
jgi:hypothetical protein